MKSKHIILERIITKVDRTNIYSLRNTFVLLNM